MIDYTGQGDYDSAKGTKPGDSDGNGTQKRWYKKGQLIDDVK
jgi:hypothetical protein